MRGEGEVVILYNGLRNARRIQGFVHKGGRRCLPPFSADAKTIIPSPDGKRILFHSDRKEKDLLQLYVFNADETGEKALTITT